MSSRYILVLTKKAGDEFVYRYNNHYNGFFASVLIVYK